MFNRIFNFGLPKTATTSLNRALEELGFHAIHNPKHFRKQAMEGCYHFAPDDWQALTNFGEHFYPQLDQAYPKSKFILTVRDEQAWLSSWKRQIGDSTGDEAGARWEWSRRLRTILRDVRSAARNDIHVTHLHSRIDIFGTYKFHAERALFVYRLHRKNAVEYFRDRPNDFLIMDITKGDGWETLCPFLELDNIPDVPFPAKRPKQAPFA